MYSRMLWFVVVGTVIGGCDATGSLEAGQRSRGGETDVTPPAQPPVRRGPADDPSAGAAPEACGGVDYQGICEGDSVRYCAVDEVVEVDCSVFGMTCGWVEEESVFYCVEREGGAAPDASPPDAMAPDASTPDAMVPDALPPSGTRPGDGVVWLMWPEQHSASNSTWGPVLTDIVRRLPTSYGSTYYDADKVTYGHETTHGINSHVRNHFREGTGTFNAFYNLEGRAILLPEPEYRKSQIGPFVPRSLRQSRFSLYLEGSRDWDDRPLYIMDEWISYINGGAVGVDRANRGLWTEEWRDAVMGPLEFTVYGIALAMATEVHDADYFRRETQFREFVAFSIRRAMEVFQAGRDSEHFRWERQEMYLRDLQTSADAEALRAFVRRVYGAAFAAETLGI